MPLKIYNVSWNDGGWHQSLPSKMVVAESIEEAKVIANEKEKVYKDWSCSASEFKIDGYVIELYEKTQYERDKKINQIIDTDENCGGWF